MSTLRPLTRRTRPSGSSTIIYSLALSLVILPAITPEVVLAAEPRLGLADVPGVDARTAVRDVLVAGIESASAAAGAAPTPLPTALRVVAATLAAEGRGEAATRFAAAFAQTVAAAVPAACAAAAPQAAKLAPRDPWALIGAGDDALTQYFRGRTEDALARAILPAVRDAAARTRLADAWRTFALAALATGTRVPELKAVQLETVVADAALRTMYARIADYEKRVRRDPLTQSELVRRAFGAAR